MPRSRRRKLNAPKPAQIVSVKPSDPRARARMPGVSADDAMGLAAGFPLENRGKPGCCDVCGRPWGEVTVADEPSIKARVISEHSATCAQCRVVAARTEFLGQYFDLLLYARRREFNRNVWGDPIGESVHETGCYWRTKDGLLVGESVALYKRHDRARWGNLVEARQEGNLFTLHTLDGGEVDPAEMMEDPPTLDSIQNVRKVLYQYYPDAELDVWHHVSVSYRNQLPSYETMAEVKRTFIGDEREAYSVWAPKIRHVSIHDYCLHLWHCLSPWAGPRGEMLPNFTAAIGTAGGIGI